MSHPIALFFIEDHRRLTALFDRAATGPGDIAHEPYSAFREGLLRHIGMEEKILFPRLREIHGSAVDGLLARLKLDHGAIVSLLVPTPSPGVVRALRSILAIHNQAEEEQGGAYGLCDAIGASEGEALLDRLRAIPEVPLRAHNDAPIAFEAARRALVLAGYSPDDFL